MSYRFTTNTLTVVTLSNKSGIESSGYVSGRKQNKRLITAVPNIPLDQFKDVCHQ